MQFKYISLSELVAIIVGGVIAVVMAATGFGYWSLVAHILIQQITLTILLWSISDWRPTSWIRREAITDLFGFSASVFATQVLQYAANNLDKLLLGKYLGGSEVGLYDKAQSMMQFPLKNGSQLIGSIMFPSLSLIQNDKVRVRDVYLRTTRAIGLVTFPMMTGMFSVSESFVLGVLGEAWAGLIPILQIFCVLGIWNSIVTVTGTVYKSQGAAALQLRVNLVTQPIRIVGVLAGLHWGAIGVAIGLMISSLIISFITLTYAGRLIGLRVTTLIKSLAPTLVPALVMAVLVWLIRPLSGLQNELQLFLIQIMSGFFIYWVCVNVMRLEAYRDVSTVLRKEFASWRSKRNERVIR